MGHTVKYLSELASEHNFVFFGDLDSTAARRKLCIKFTHQYNEDVYRYCAAKGHAPKLHVVQCLPGGSFYSSSGLGPNPATHRDKSICSEISIPQVGLSSAYIRPRNLLFEDLLKQQVIDISIRAVAQSLRSGLTMFWDVLFSV